MPELKNQEESPLKEKRPKGNAWKSLVAKYQKPNALRASWQLINTLGAYAVVLAAIYFTLGTSLWLTSGLIVIGGGLVVRIFTISHDCGHGSFFASKRANSIVGFITGVLSLTPYQHWRWEHARHHATSGDLDRRGMGDVWVMTVQEFLDATPWTRFCYRVARHPVALLVAGPLFLFLINNRYTTKGAGNVERLSIYGTNLCILLLAVGMSWLVGFQTYLWIHLAIIMVSGSSGVWLFYVQHQFEDVYWERGKKWDFLSAALGGSSFYKLPRVLQWFSGNIGFHHIHHLSARIPNYNLEACHNSDPLFHQVKPLTFRDSIRCFGYHLLDEEAGKMISFRQFSKRAA
tara:strand:- start:79 stop:1116 length:1038 start_codon:yes stop_codon:yes gene_type:complete